MADAPAPSIVPTRKEAARRLGITERALCDWVKDPSFPAGAVGKDARGHNRDWNLPAIQAWRDAMGRKGSEPEDDERARAAHLRKVEAEAAIKEADARDRERKEQVALGNLLPRDEYEAALIEIITVTRDRLLTLPGRLAKLPSVKNRRVHKTEAARELEKILTSLDSDLDTIEQRAA